MKTFINTLSNAFILIATILITIAFGGCATTPTRYERSTAAKGEIVWGYDRGLNARKDTTVICGDDWSGLSRAVADLPAAKNLAESAHDDHTTGTVLWWGGVSIMVGGVILGAAVMAEDFSNNENNNSPFNDSGFWIMMGGLGLGGVFAGSGDYLIQQGTADAIDAVNMYNCTITSKAKTDSTRSSH